MKEKRDILDGVEISQLRRYGNSTRQIDKAIQLLFSGFVVEVLDHYQNGRDKNMNKILFKRILKRLEDEHYLPSLIKRNIIKIDYSKLTIELDYQNQF